MRVPFINFHLTNNVGRDMNSKPRLLGPEPRPSDTNWFADHAPCGAPQQARLLSQDHHPAHSWFVGRAGHRLLTCEAAEHRPVGRLALCSQHPESVCNLHSEQRSHCRAPRPHPAHQHVLFGQQTFVQKGSPPPDPGFQLLKDQMWQSWVPALQGGSQLCGPPL